MNTQQKVLPLQESNGAKEKAQADLKRELAGFTGTTQYYKCSFLSKLAVTDGIQFLRNRANCYWLFDIVASYQKQLAKYDARFQVWKVIVNDDNSAVVTCREDSDQPEIVRKEIGYTDFLLDELEFWCIDGVILLKNEY